MAQFEESFFEHLKEVSGTEELVLVAQKLSHGLEAQRVAGTDLHDVGGDIFELAGQLLHIGVVLGVFVRAAVSYHELVDELVPLLVHFSPVEGEVREQRHAV